MSIESNTHQKFVLSRRKILGSACALSAFPLIGCGGGGTDDTLAETTSGTFRGSRLNNTIAFKGIPYAQAPVGALRFKSPKTYKPMPGISDATRFGAASYQTFGGAVKWIYPTPELQSEDCLTLNIWTPTRSGRLPVIVFLHGGAWRTGSPSMPLMDGDSLASAGCVVVTVSFRLGTFGSLAHPKFMDGETGLVANWQLQDQLAAIQWVSENIEAFGGDPKSICLIGQSAGASSAAALSQHEVGKKIIRRTVLLSPALLQPPTTFTLDDACAYTELLASQLGVSVDALQSVDAMQLHTAELALNATALPVRFTSGRGFKPAPVVDGNFYRFDIGQAPWPKDIPVIFSNTATEGNFFVNLYDAMLGAYLTAPSPASRPEALARISALLGSTDRGLAVTQAYEQAAITETRVALPADIYAEIFGDNLLRSATVKYARAASAAGADVRYLTYGHDIKAPGGSAGAPHCAELPFLFGTYSLEFYRTKVGSASVEDEVSRKYMKMVIEFASSGAPRLDSGAAWPQFSGTSANTAVLGSGVSSNFIVSPLPKSAQLESLNN